MTSKDNTFQCPLCDGAHPFHATECPEKHVFIPPVYRLHTRTIDEKYDVVRIIGEGGMGIVYEGKHRAIGRKVAIKFLFPESLNYPDAIARFHNEARIAASITHKNIVDIFDMGITRDQIPYIVMEYLLGYSLSDILGTASALLQPMAIDITLEILSALNAVHSRGIVHRDLKPDNIFLVEQVGGEDIVKVLDFGICHLTERFMEREGVTKIKSGFIAGTPKYMSPEQASGSKNMDSRSDLYSVGVLLYQMLAGKVPFEGERYSQVISAIMRGEPVPPSRHNPDIHPRLEGIILKAMAKDPQNRFSSAGEFAGYLMMLKSSISKTEVDVPSIVTALPSEVLKKMSSEAGRAIAEKGLPPAPVERPAAGKSEGQGQSIASAGRAELPSAPPERHHDTTPGDISKASTLLVEAPEREAPPVPSRPAPAAEHRAVRKHLGKVLIVFSLVAAFFIGMLFSRFGKITVPDADTMKGEQAFSGQKKPKGQGVKKLRVDIVGVSEDASVYIDDVLFSTRPFLIEAAPFPRKFQIKARGFHVWEKSLIVTSDITFFIQLIPLGASKKGSKKPRGAGN